MRTLGSGVAGVPGVQRRRTAAIPVTEIMGEATGGARELYELWEAAWRVWVEDQVCSLQGESDREGTETVTEAGVASGSGWPDTDCGEERDGEMVGSPRLPLEGRFQTVRESLEKILRLKRAGVSNRRIAERFGVSDTFVGELLRTVGRTRDGWSVEIQ